MTQDQELHSDKKWGEGFRALVIRNYHASLNNVEYKNPCISLIGLQKRPSMKANLQLAITTPSGVDFFRKGDNISLEVELITLPRKSQDYYGPNQTFRTFMEENDGGWRVIHREANGNDLQTEIIGGSLISNYPLRIKVTNDSRVEVKIAGGVGAVPVRFEGLSSTDYVLNEMKSKSEERFAPEVHGNDYWQTDYNVKTLFCMTFNIPINTATSTESTWVLQKAHA